jgi:hypothetical protein
MPLLFKDVFEVVFIEVSAALLISSAASGNAREAKIAVAAIHPPPPRNRLNVLFLWV